MVVKSVSQETGSDSATIKPTTRSMARMIRLHQSDQATDELARLGLEGIADLEPRASRSRFTRDERRVSAVAL